MEKEKVLEIEIIKINDEWSVAHITYQNEDILKRGEFRDGDLRVYSYFEPTYDSVNKQFYIRGKSHHRDKVPFIIKNSRTSILLEKINEINDKYGIPERWRAEKYKPYFYINFYGKVSEMEDYFYEEDNILYNIGNYFKTREEAEKVIDSKEWKEFWAKVRAGEIGGDK